MSGIVALSINYNSYGEPGMSIDQLNQKFIDDLFWKNFYHQHLGQEYGGMAALPNNSKSGQAEILLRTHRGLFREQFKNDLVGFQGPQGIAHIGSLYREPIDTDSAFPYFVIGFTGNLSNRDDLIIELKNEGASFVHTYDISVVSKLIVRAGWQDNLSVNDNFVNGINYMTERIEGSYALAILTLEKIYVARGPDAHELLTIGKKKGAVVVSSESTGFFNQRFVRERDIEPGEIVVLKNGELSSIASVKTKKKIFANVCSFKKVYTEFPTSMTLDISSAEVRRRLGAKLAQKDIKDGFFPDVVTPIPASGVSHAIGYHQEFIRQARLGKISPGEIPYYDELLCKYSYAGRSYISHDKETRDKEAIKKIEPVLDGKYKGQKAVVVDDSIVRGTQSSNDLVPKIRATGVAEIHFRISNPKLVDFCKWGKSNKKKDELAAFDNETGRIISEEEMAKKLGVDSCKFNTCKDIAEAIGMKSDSLCMDCSKLSD